MPKNVFPLQEKYMLKSTEHSHTHTHTHAHIFTSNSLIKNLILNTKLPKWFNKHCKMNEKLKSDPKGTFIQHQEKCGHK